MSEQKIHIGIDDTDSLLYGMCTTYIAALIAEKVNIAGYPRLIRLNPNIPYKTKGNGALHLIAVGNKEEIKKVVLDIVGKYAVTGDANTNPGIIFLDDAAFKKNRGLIGSWYSRTVSELVHIGDAEKIAEKIGAETYGSGNRRGIIGALAAIGADLSGDRTFEILCYRKKENYGKKRRIDGESVRRMNDATYPHTFNNLDGSRILICPKGGDPIFCGIRGEDPKIVERAKNIVRPLEPIEMCRIFETNQGTDCHLRPKKIKAIRPYDCVIIDGTVKKGPHTIAGGHIFFTLEDNTGSIDCGAYAKTGKLKNAVNSLEIGDIVEVCGGIGKYPHTVNIEKINVKKLSEIKKEVPPVCNACRKNMHSYGRNAGFVCKKCGAKSKSGEIITIERKIKKGIYEPPPGSQRHLMKPLIRET